MVIMKDDEAWFFHGWKELAAIRDETLRKEEEIMTDLLELYDDADRG